MNDGFSIIIPTYNRAALLRIALTSVQALRLPEGWRAEVVVIDNNSTDQTAKVVEDAARGGPLEVRRIVETQQGLSYGRNRGLREARFEHLVYLDDDMQVNPGWLEGYVAAQAAFDTDCVVGPVEPWFEGEIPAWVSPRVLHSVTSAYSRKGEEMMPLEADVAHELPGCNFAVRRHAGREAGGFDPMLGRSGKIMLGGEDWEFGERLVLLGKRVVYTPRCGIRHFISDAKLSKDGLRKRWIGFGATQRAFMRLRDQDPSFPHQVRMFLRMNRFFLRSFRYRVADDPATAFRWELEARKIWGSLFGCPRGMQPRLGPPFSMSKPESVTEVP